MLHMAGSAWIPGEGYLWRCRCGASGRGMSTQDEARHHGDLHLAAANGHSPAPDASADLEARDE